MIECHRRFSNEAHLLFTPSLTTRQEDQREASSSQDDHAN
jgi:hypothetical protein